MRCADNTDIHHSRASSACTRNRRRVMTDDLPELTDDDFASAIPAHVRAAVDSRAVRVGAGCCGATAARAAFAIAVRQWRGHQRPYIGELGSARSQAGWRRARLATYSSAAPAYPARESRVDGDQLRVVLRANGAGPFVDGGEHLLVARLELLGVVGS